MINLGIMASGRGSNAEAILQACEDGKLAARGVVFVSNRADAGVHEIAKRFNILSFHIARDQFEDGGAFTDRLIQTFRSFDVHLILLAGYMRKIPSALLREWDRAVLNIHPALLPKHGGKGMYGLKVHQSVIESGERETGVTVHFVNEEYDRGATLFQVGGIPVFTNDTAEILAARVLEFEHRTYPQAVNLWIELNEENYLKSL